MSVAKAAKLFGGRIKPTKVVKQRPASDEEDESEEDDDDEESTSSGKGGAGVQPLNSPEPPVDASVINARAAVDDLVLMPQDDVSEQDIVNVLGARFGQDKIYTYIGTVLVAMNPFKMINNLYTDQTLRSYAGKKQFQRPPHVYALADGAYSRMMQFRTSQCVIISGESGAGKTETSKFIIQYINGVSGGRSEVARTKQRLQASNPILEGFGNATTINNNNSSRFGKFMKILFDPYGDPIGGSVVNYLLEKSRVVQPGKNERNFHVFYQMCVGASQADRNAFNILDAEEYFYLSESGRMTVNGINDAQDWTEMMEAFNAIGVSRVHRDDVLCTLSAILWLGNLSFVEVSDEVSAVEDREILGYVADLLQVDIALLDSALITRRITTGSGDKQETFIKPNTIKQSDLHRDTLAKALYSKLFDFMVKLINEALKVDTSKPKKKKTAQEEADDSLAEEQKTEEQKRGMYIAVLDIYGFEIFPFNSFEQLCINFVNEKLQQIFIELTLEAEQAEYAAEGLPWKNIPFNDNKPLCALIEGKPGLLSLCDDCCATNKSDSNFMMDIKNFFSEGRLAPFIKCTAADFTITHYAGKVKYAVDNFLAKNKDTLFDDLIIVMQSSRRALARDHGWLDLEVSTGQKKRPLTVGFQFKQQVTLLMNELHRSQQYYVRCIKTNTEKKANLFDAINVARQVQYLGLLENIKVRRAGYAYRNEFAEFVKRYIVLSKTLNGRRTQETDPRTLCQILCEEIHWTEGKEYVMGKTKIFLQDAKTLYILEDKIRQREDSAACVIQRIYRRFKASIFFRVIKTRSYDLVKGRKDRRRASIHDRYVGDHINATYNQDIQDVLSQNCVTRPPAVVEHNVGANDATASSTSAESCSSPAANTVNGITLARDQTTFASPSEKLLFADRVKLIRAGSKSGLLCKIFGKKNLNAEGQMETTVILILTNHALYCLSMKLNESGEPKTELDFRVPLRHIRSMVASPFADDFVIFHYTPRRRGMPSDSLFQIRHKTELFGLMVEAQGQLAGCNRTDFELTIKERDELTIREKEGKSTIQKVKWLPDDSPESGLEPGGNFRCDVNGSKIKIHVSSGVPLSQVPVPNRVGSMDTYVPGPPSLRALYDYRSSHPDTELSFTAGQIITLIKDMKDGWYLGEDPITGTQGKVPCSYVVRMKRPKLASEPDDAPSIAQLLGAPLNVQSAPALKPKTPKVASASLSVDASDGSNEAPIHPKSTRSTRCQFAGCTKKKFGERTMCMEHFASQGTQ